MILFARSRLACQRRSGLGLLCIRASWSHCECCRLGEERAGKWREVLMSKQDVSHRVFRYGHHPPADSELLELDGYSFWRGEMMGQCVTWQRCEENGGMKMIDHNGPTD
jgi:hypothetical protein